MSPTARVTREEERATLTLAYLASWRGPGAATRQESDRTRALCVGVLSLTAGQVQLTGVYCLALDLSEMATEAVTFQHA
eukprot:6254696-Amphidinium_carterae.2